LQHNAQFFTNQSTGKPLKHQYFTAILSLFLKTKKKKIIFQIFFSLYWKKEYKFLPHFKIYAYNWTSFWLYFGFIKERLVRNY